MTTFDIYPHFFTITNPTQAIMGVIYGVASDYTTFKQEYDYKTRKNSWVPDKSYVYFTKDNNHFRFHIGQWVHFQRRIERHEINPAEIEIVTHEPFFTDPVALPVRKGWKLRGGQLDAKQFILEKPKEERRPLLNIFTGGGKTVTALVTASEIGGRLCVLVLARFADKWKSDLQEVYDIEEKDICMIAGKKSGDLLKDASHWGSANKAEYPLPKAYIITIETLMVWIRKYTEGQENPALSEYGCALDDFFETLDVRVTIIDEVHMSMHLVYQCYTFLTSEWVINCSATMLTSNLVMQRVQSMMFPAHARFDKLEIPRYTKAYACAYQIRGFSQARIEAKEYGSNNYSHSAFERTLFRNKRLKQQYLDMICNLVEDTYIKPYVKGDKIAIYVARKETAIEVVTALKRRWKSFDIRTYLETDPFENALDPDMRVTTTIGFGTGIDVKMLSVVIQTVSVDSVVTNVQSLGRLREQADRDSRFYWLYCTDVQKQVDYHHNRKEILKNRTKSIDDVILTPLDATKD